ncbi:MAG: LytR C-terminal domain-containing protein [Leptospiraceae bacterium]|nr:LytR C-terminal domain-containing protein [Leptospiraceae bacterium]
MYYINPLSAFSEKDDIIENSGNYLSKNISSQLNEITSHPVDFTINLSESSFIRIIDILGGLEMYFDPYTFQSSVEYKRKIGEYLMSGHEVFDVMKLKNKNDPLDYINRLNIQESVVFTIFDNLIKNQKKMRKEWIEFITTLMDTNLTTIEIFSIYKYLLANHIIFMVSELPGKLTVFPGSEQPVLFIEKELAKTAFEKFESDLLDEEFPYEEIAKIEILNGTAVPGLAKKVKSFLNVKRFNVLSVSNAWTQNQKVSMVINRSGNSEYTYKIAEVLGIKKVHHIISKESGMDTTILLGENFENF